MTVNKTTLSDEEAQMEAVPEMFVVEAESVDPQKNPSIVDKPTSTEIIATNDSLEEAKLPAAFYCPLTKKVMVDPVVHPSGDSYEREAILSRQGDDSLMTFYPNRALKSYIDSEMERLEESGSMRGTLRTWVEKTALALGESRPLPDEFYCTLTLDLCHEPVIDPDGYTYERQAIVHWVNNNGDSPVTRKSLTVEQLYDNNAVLNILLQESEKPDEEMHPCIRRWKDELSSPPPSIVPEVSSSPESRIVVIPRNGEHRLQSAHYPTTREEMEERIARDQRKSMLTLLLIIIIISFALVYLPFHMVLFALAFCSCLYARRQFNRRRARAYEVQVRTGERPVGPMGF